jgi:hypothetical protein
MEQIDYACGIDCPNHYDDDQMLREFVITDDHELMFLNTYLHETFAGKEWTVEGA